MRIMRIRFSIDLLIHLLTQDTVISILVAKGLPPGTKYCYSIHCEFRSIDFVVSHESFPELNDGDIIPFWNEDGRVIMHKLEL